MRDTGLKGNPCAFQNNGDLWGRSKTPLSRFSRPIIFCDSTCDQNEEEEETEVASKCTEHSARGSEIGAPEDFGHASGELPPLTTQSGDIDIFVGGSLSLGYTKGVMWNIYLSPQPN